MKIERVVEIAGTPILVTGEGKTYKGWTIAPARYTIPSGVTLDVFLVEKGERKTLCSSEQLAHRWITRREAKCLAERP